MESTAATANRYSFVNIVCYWVIFFSSLNLIKLLVRSGAAERNIKPINPSAANYLGEWQFNVFEAVHKILQQQFLLSVMSILIAVTAIVLAIFAIKRSEWARKGLIAVFAFKVATVIITFAFTFFTTNMLVNNVSDRLKNVPGSAGRPPFEMFTNLITVMAGIFTIVILILYLWIITRLKSESVKSQFTVYNP